MNIFIVIPAYNEQTRLPQLLKKIKKLHSELPIIIVDDGSLKPLKISLTPKTYLLRHQLNLGKGAALKTGIEFAIKKGADAFILMDADLQHDPEEIKDFIKKLNQSYDIVFGVRSFGQQTPLIRFLGNKFASIYIGLLFGIFVSDILSGYRAFTKKTYQLIKWQPEPPPGYAVETEMIARFGKHKHNLKYIEIPIKTIYVDKYKGVTILNAIRILFKSLTWKLF